MKFRGTVEVMMRPEITDPHGRSIMMSLKGAGFAEVQAVHSGKLIEVEFEAEPDQAAETLERMARDLLANRVTEVYALKLDPIHEEAPTRTSEEKPDPLDEKEKHLER